MERIISDYLAALILSLSIAFFLAMPISTFGSDEAPKDWTKISTRTEGGLICTGFNPDTKEWGLTGILGYGSKSHNCPEHYAFVGVTRVLGTKRDGKFIPLSGTCCPVPKDLLTDEHVFTDRECPDNHVATGAQQAENIKDSCKNLSRMECQKLWLKKSQNMRCTKINTQRYMLGALESMYVWGWQPHFRTLRDRKTTKSRMPVAIRYGIGRKDQKNWYREGCIAYPWGSFLVKKTSKYCDGMFSRALLYTGAEGDPPRGKPVNYLADCRALSDPLSKDAECLR